MNPHCDQIHHKHNQPKNPPMIFFLPASSTKKVIGDKGLVCLSRAEAEAGSAEQFAHSLYPVISTGM
jgi:hypothetical protein